MRNSNIGIQNTNNLCFINSVLQMLYSIPDIRVFILKSNTNDNVINSLKEIFNLLSNNKSFIRIDEIEEAILYLHNITEFKETVKNRFGKDITITLNFKKTKEIKQQDAEQFYSKIINILFDNPYLQELFTFEYITSSYCREFNKKNIYDRSNLTNNYTLLSLNISDYKDKKKNMTLEDLIRFNFEEEFLGNNCYLTKKINGVVGKRCKEKNINCKETSINIPVKNKYLVIQLARMAFHKVMNNFIYGFIDDNINIKNTLNINNNNYSLIGSILRYSSDKSSNSGHYIYVTYKDNKIKKVYNDEKVTEFLNEPFNLNKHSYILLYIKNDIVIEQKDMDIYQQRSRFKLLLERVKHKPLKTQENTDKQSAIELYKEGLTNEILKKINLTHKKKENTYKQSAIELYKEGLINEILKKINLAHKKKENLVENKEIKALNNNLKILQEKVSKIMNLKNSNLIEMQTKIQTKIQEDIEKNKQKKIKEKIDFKLARNIYKKELIEVISKKKEEIYKTLKNTQKFKESMKELKNTEKFNESMKKLKELQGELIDIVNTENNLI